MNNKFEQDLLVGRIGESKAESILCGLDSILWIADVTNDKYFQEKDVDFLAEREDGKVFKYEVKTDTKAHETGNIFFEITTCGHIGCLSKSEADYILYYIPETDDMLGFWLDEIREYIECNKGWLKETKGGDGATGYLLKISDLKRLNLIREVYE